jgi:hypothetical protein
MFSRDAKAERELAHLDVKFALRYAKPSRRG